VRGDAIDITPLRTKLFEFGSGPETDGSHQSWITARQPTGRVVTVSNRKTFTEPVFNYSAHLDWVWEEVVVAIPQDADWARAETILLEEIRTHAPELRRQGEAALARLGERFLLSRAEVEPQTFIRIAQGDVEVVGRFVTRVRSSRAARDQITRRVLERLRAEAIAVAYPTYAVSLDGSRAVG
jgi:small-conductance mechanosensitive channel